MSFVSPFSSFEHNNDARTANENAARLLHHYVQLFSILGAVGLFRYDMLLIFNMVCHDLPAGQFVSVRNFLIAAKTRYSGFFLLSLVTRFACDIGQLAKI